MAAGKDQAQAVVGNLAHVEDGSFDDWLGSKIRIGFQFFLQACLPSQAIDGFVFGCLNDPGARRIGNAVRSPLIDGRRKRVLCGIFGQFEIAKLAY